MDGDTTASVAGTPHKKRARGRKDSSGTEEITQPAVVKGKLQHLVDGYHEVCTVRTQFNDDLKAVAEESGYLTSALRSHVVAIHNNTYLKHQQRVSQQMELFEEAGPLQQ